MFVGRDTEDKIYIACSGWAEDATEEIDDDDPELVAFLNPPPRAETISDRQFFQQLAVMDLITETEALAYVQTGELPAAFLTFINQLPESARFDAKMKLIGANSFERSNALVGEFGTMQGMTSAQIDALWQAASEL